MAARLAEAAPGRPYAVSRLFPILLQGETTYTIRFLPLKGIKLLAQAPTDQARLEPLQRTVHVPTKT